MSVRGGEAAGPASRIRPRRPLEARVRRAREVVIHTLLFLCAFASILTTFGIIATLLEETVGFFRVVSIWEYLTDTKWTPAFSPAHYGILPLLAGTLLVAAFAALFAIPIGLMTAIFLSEYAPGWLRSIIKPVLEVLAGIPTVVLGFFALTFLARDIVQPLFGTSQIFSALAASIAVGIMIIPLISSLSEDAMAAVPRSLRDGAYALGATRFEVAMRVVMPAAVSGIVAACILALSPAGAGRIFFSAPPRSTPTHTLYL